MLEDKNVLKEKLEEIYCRYNRREFVHPDPLEFLYRYERPEDLEIAAVFASALAYGRVGQILKTVDRILGIMGKSPYDYLLSGDHKKFSSDFEGIVHRFATGEKIASLALGTKKAISGFGSLESCFMSFMTAEDTDTNRALALFASEIRKYGLSEGEHLIPSPEKGGASKRLHLMLRWMVRKDAVDPGIWSNVGASKLVVPLDVHMHRIAGILGLTSRKQANLKAALEITAGFAEIQPEDPVKYDFALTRLGIRKDSDISELFE